VPELLIFGVLAGLDNLQVCAALGLARPRRARLVALATTFALCEAAMPLVGLAIGGTARAWVPGLEAAGPVVLLLCGAALLVHALREAPGRDAAAESGWLLGLPLVLSLDNLVAGVGLGSAGYPVLPSALAVGAVSGGMCLAGFFAGGWAGRWVPRRAEVLSGAFLVVLALVALAGSGA
jgi:manganese efflux pump family protein